MGTERAKTNQARTKVEHGLELERQQVMTKTRNGRVMRIRRWTTLQEIGINDSNEDDRKVDVWLVLNQIQGGIRVRGRAVSELIRSCDRCMAEFSEQSDGRFEILLRDDELDDVHNPEKRLRKDMDKLEEIQSEIEMQVEDVVDFRKTSPTVSLDEHVRDAVHLGLPTKALCKQDCGGISMLSSPEIGSVTYGGQDIEDVEEEEELKKFEEPEEMDFSYNEQAGLKNIFQGNPEAAKKLKSLKKKLEEQGK